ncbi:MAG TPA: hypothetical protein VKE41_13705 [Roseiflexaceae bacterium]|nr:hypothetical protein [Roseiflexaceae bacterium]
MLGVAQAFKRFTIAGIVALALAGMVGTQGVLAASKTAPAKIKVGIQPSTQADAGGFTAYTITAINDGDNAAGNVTINVLFDPSALRFVGATFSQHSAWVSNITDKALEIKTGVVGGDGGSVKAVVRFQALGSSSAPAVQRLSFKWTDKAKGGKGISNQLPSAGAPNAYAALTASQNASEITFASDAFASNEGVVFWYNTPDGKVIQTRVRRGYLIDAEYAKQKSNDDSSYEKGAQSAFANDQGQVAVTLSTAKLAPGTYSLVAYGNSSGLTAVTAFQVK